MTDKTKIVGNQVQRDQEPVIRSRIFFKENLNEREPVVRDNIMRNANNQS